MRQIPTSQAWASASPWTTRKYYTFTADTPPRPCSMPLTSVPKSTSALYFANKTHLPVAKIEGNGEYKRAMRAHLLPYTETPSIRYFGDGALGDAWDAWLFTDKPDCLQHGPTSPSTAALSAMLLALKAVTEPHIGSREHELQIVLPYLYPISHHAQFECAASAAAIYAHSFHFDAAGIYASLLATKPTDGDLLVLTLDYSRAALTAQLYAIDKRLPGVWRTGHYPDLGTDALAGSRIVGNETAYWEEVARAVRSVTALPDGYTGLYGDGPRRRLHRESVVTAEGVAPLPAPKTISKLVLMGERALSQARLLSLLEEALGAEVVGDAVPAAGDDGAGIERGAGVEPVFAAAVGAAREGWALAQPMYLL